MHVTDLLRKLDDRMLAWMQSASTSTPQGTVKGHPTSRAWRAYWLVMTTFASLIGLYILWTFVVYRLLLA